MNSSYTRPCAAWFTTALLTSVAACDSTSISTMSTMTPTDTGDELVSSTGLAVGRLISGVASDQPAETQPPLLCPPNAPEPADVEADTDYVFDIEIVAPDNACLPAASSVEVELFGFDNLMADVAANSLIGGWQSIPWHGDDYFRIGFNRADWSAVEHQSGGDDALHYYAVVYVDMNGDGRICNGDLRQDYDLSPFEAFPASQTRTLEVLFMKVVEDQACD